MNLIRQLFARFTPSPKKPNYQIDELLYLNDWETYASLLNTTDILVLREVFIFRAWLYNFAFRRVVADRDEYVEPMLNELFGLLKTLGAGVFLNTRRLELGNIMPDPVSIRHDTDLLMDLLLERFEEYDGALITAAGRERADLQYILGYVNRQLLKHLNHDPVVTALARNVLLAQMMEDVFLPATDVARKIAK